MKTSQSNRSFGHVSRSLALAAAVLAGLATGAGAQEVTTEQPQQQQQGGGGGGRRQQLQQDGTNQDQQGGGGNRRQFQQDPNNPDATGGGRRGRGGGGGGGFNGGGGGGGFGGRQQQFTAMQTPTGDTFTQEYGDLSAHNIFMRYRGIPERPVASNTGPRAPEELTVLVGVVKQDDGAYQAIIEDAARAQIIYRSSNDTIATGKILEINNVGIVYKPADKDQVTVPVGANLFGVYSNISSVRVGAAGLRASDYTGFSGGQNNLPLNGRGGNIGGAFNNNTGLGGTGRRGGNGFTNQTPVLTVAPPPLPGSDGMSLEERMRMRRASEGLPSAAVPISAQPTAPAPAPVVETAPAAAPIVDPAIGGSLSLEEQMRLRRQLGN